MSENHAYSPYGAYEMKASYQRNMLIGNFAVLGLVAMLLSVAWLNSLGVEPPIVIEPKIGIEWTPSPPQPFDPNKIRIKRQAQKMPIKQGTIPTMMPDSLFDDDEDPIVLVSIDDVVDVRGIGGDEVIPHDSNTYFVVGGNGGGGDPVYPGENEFVPFEKEPELYFYKEPAYPRLCKQAGIEGEVMIKVLVDKDGTVKKALVVKSSGVEALDRAALSVAYENKFTPALQNGIAISLWVSYKVTFSLQ